MRAKLIEAILVRNFGKTEELLKSGAFNINDNDLENTVPVLNALNRNLALSSIVHVAVSTNNPKILSLLINEYRANVRQIEQLSQSKFLSVLINRTFDTDVSTFSALKNLDILYRSGASLPESVVQQLIVNFDHMPQHRDNLRKIIKKLYVLKATHAFLDHVKNNRIKEANYIRTTNIKTLYPDLKRLGISGYINPNYDAGVHGMAVLMAAELPNLQMLESLRSKPLPWLTEIDLNLSNTEGLTILHVFSMTGNLYGVEWLFNTVNKNQKLHLLVKKVVRPDGQKYTPNDLATLYNYHEMTSFLENFAIENNDFALEQIIAENPDRLKDLHKMGFHFNRVHSATLGNALHYSVLGVVSANIRWVWNRFSALEKVQFLLGKMQYATNGVLELVSPLQLAQRVGRNNHLRVLHDFAVELAEVVGPHELGELKNAGYHLNCSITL